MSKISVKYLKGTSAADIAALEKKYGLQQENHIPALRIYGYANGSRVLKKIAGETIVEYAEKQDTIGIAD